MYYILFSILIFFVGNLLVNENVKVFINKSEYIAATRLYRTLNVGTFRLFYFYTVAGKTSEEQKQELPQKKSKLTVWYEMTSWFLCFLQQLRIQFHSELDICSLILCLTVTDTL